MSEPLEWVTCLTEFVESFNDQESFPTQRQVFAKRAAEELLRRQAEQPPDTGASLLELRAVHAAAGDVLKTAMRGDMYFQDFLRGANAHSLRLALVKLQDAFRSDLEGSVSSVPVRPSTRESVYTYLDAERAYQDETWGTITDRPKEVGSWLTLLQYLISTSRERWATSRGDEPALDVLRKLAASAVACLEQHGVPPRLPGVPQRLPE